MNVDQASVVLEVADLSKSYGQRQAVRGVSFSVRAGEIFGLLGPNGAGKTTTIGMIATIVSATGGTVRVNGEGIAADLASVKRKVGLVPQRVCLYPTLSAEENLRFFGRMYGLAGAGLESRLQAMLELAGLEQRRHDEVADFSGGMQRRLNLACGLIHEPELLLLDEPTVGLDPQSRERIFSSVEALAAQGMAVLYTTHYMEEAESLCQRVAIMDEGRFVAEGTTRELAAKLGREQTIIVIFEKEPTAKLRSRLLEQDSRQAGTYQFQLAGEVAVARLIPELLQLASDEKIPIKELVVHRPNLGEVFLHLTGKELRD